jgi:DNA-binding transcriptional LysR family regulator
VQSGLADIGIIQRAPEPDPSIVSIPAWHDDVIGVISHQHPHAGFKPLSAEQLSQERIVVCVAEHVRKPVEDWFAAHAVKLQNPLEVSSFPEVRTNVLEGLGIGFLPQFLVVEDLAAGRLEQIKIEGLHITQDTHVIFRTNVSQRAEWLVHKMLQSAHYSGEAGDDGYAWERSLLPAADDASPKRFQADSESPPVFSRRAVTARSKAV